MFVEFSLKLVYATMCGTKLQIYGVHITIKCIESRNFYSSPPPHSRLYPMFSSSHSKQRKITHSRREYFFENLFPSTAERGGGNYDLHYQSSFRKYEDDLEH